MEISSFRFSGKNMEKLKFEYEFKKKLWKHCTVFVLPPFFNKCIFKIIIICKKYDMKLAMKFVEFFLYHFFP